MDSLLGETLQQEKEDGTKFYGEIVGSNPPICLFNVYGPNNLYKVTGSIKVYFRCVIIFLRLLLNYIPLAHL